MKKHPDSHEVKEFLRNVHSLYGYDFTDYSQTSVIRRIEHYLTLHKIDDLTRLEKIIRSDESVLEDFIQELSVTVTEMFRDPAFYKSLKENVLKRLATYPVIKIWIAGCATGEEVYSISILLKEAKLLDRSLIYATDINQKSLQIAKDGVYSLESMKLYTENYHMAGGEKPFSDYYKAKYNSVLFDKSLKQNIIFSPHNLAADKSFNEFQLIICRNVLIYFNQALQNKVITLLHNSLCHFGYLGLGDKESLLFSERKNYFTEIDKKEKIFMKTREKSGNL